MATWGCPNEISGRCEKVQGRQCQPGMKGCVLHGKTLFQADIDPDILFTVTAPERQKDRQELLAKIKAANAKIE